MQMLLYMCTLTPINMSICILHRSRSKQFQIDEATTKTHYYRSDHLSRFQRAICPGFGTGIRLPGQKPLSRVVEPRAKKSLHPAGFEPKNYYLAYDFLANSPK